VTDARLPAEARSALAEHVAQIVIAPGGRRRRKSLPRHDGAA
jgi:hypothetical protein